MTLDTDRDFAEPGETDRNDPRLVEEARREEPPALDWSRVMGRRLVVLAWVALVWMAGISARLVFLQVISHDELMARAQRQQEDREIVPAPRGEIVDRHGAVLAMSVRGYALEGARRRTKDTDPEIVRQLVQDPDGAAARVCAVLDHCAKSDRAEMAQALRTPASPKAARYVFLRRQISAEEARRVVALNEPGIRAVEARHRFYPSGETAAHVIGYVNADNVGKTGLEFSYEPRVAGENGRQIVQVTALRQHKRLSARVLEEPRAGATLETTIDRELQFIAERELAAAVAENRAQGGCVIIADPWNGDILAMANAPTFDPNRPGEFNPELLQNRCAQHIYEPGSTFKIVTAAAALEVARMSPSRIFDVSLGYYQFNGSRVHDFHHYNQLSFTDVFVKSSNVGAIKIGLELGPEVISRYVSRFGFGETLARDIPHQRSGIVDRNMAGFGARALGSVSMGYQIGVTPLQMAAAVSSVANGGELVAPRLVRATVSENGRVEMPRRVIRRTINAETAAALTPILEQVVERGTATIAKIDGYTIAGKTGTAAKLVNGRYSKSEYNASFVGFLPSRQPRVTIIAVIDSPHGHGYTGGVVAAPVFKRVAEATLRYLGIPPNVGDATTVLVNAAPRGAEPTTIALRAGARGSQGGVDLDTRLAIPAGTMPDVRGLSGRDAVRLLARVGVEARLSGDGFVAAQAIPPGATLSPGRACALSLRRDAAGLSADEGGAQP
jgi:cell division protein FtsI (penicillin-binding protein 3)